MGDQPLPCMSVSQIQQSLRESVRKVVEKCTTNLFMFLASLGTTLVKTNPPATAPTLTKVKHLSWHFFLYFDPFPKMTQFN